MSADKSQTIIEAIDGVGAALNEIARALQNLGNANASTPMGALEAHGVALKEAGEEIAKAISFGLEGIGETLSKMDPKP